MYGDPLPVMAIASDHSMGSSPIDLRKAKSPRRAGSFRPWITNTFRASALLGSIDNAWAPHLIERFDAQP